MNILCILITYYMTNKREWFESNDCRYDGLLIAVQQFVITFLTNCELVTIPMLFNRKREYSVIIKNKQKLKGGMNYD
ncbi:hypothetical protein COE25_10835 [Bacillus sp. AFS031507]|nr:hypothetical protein COE25_10835 [Bacillus sp. AFS031507]